MTRDELTSLAQYYHYQTEVSMKDKNQEAAIEELEQAENQDKTCSDLDELGDLSQILEMARQLGIDTDGLETSGEKEKNCCCTKPQSERIRERSDLEYVSIPFWGSYPRIPT